jgi:tight adherence protein B
MIVVLVACCGAMFAGGLFMSVRALIGTVVVDEPVVESKPPPSFVDRFDRLGLRAGMAAATGVLIAAMTGWPIGSLLAAVAGFLVPSLLGGKATRDLGRARLDAIATWTEQLRDVMAAASGLEGAVMNTAPYAPPAIRAEVNRLVAALESGTSMRSALRRFAAQLDDPAGDLVVAALILAAEGSPRQIGDLLSRLAATSREEVKMRMRIETGRARTRSSVKVVTAVTIGFSFGLVILNPEYVAAYRGVTGQLVLIAVAACFGGAYWWLARAGRSTTSARFLVSGDAPVTVEPRREMVR